MRVMCVEDAGWKGTDGRPNPNGPKYGDIDTVVGQETCKTWGLFYLLAGYDGYSYQAKYFIPVSEIDETTFERNYKKELV